MAEEANPLARTVEQATREAMAALMGTEGETPPETPAPEAGAPAAAAPEAAQPEVKPETPVTQEPEAPGTEVPVVQASEEETPTEWFGVDLAGIPAEKRAEIIGSFKERDKTINRLFQERAAPTQEATPQTGPNPPAPQPVEQPKVEPPTDAEILAQLGIQEDDPMYEFKSETVLPLAKVLLQQQEAVNQMAQQQFLQNALNDWNKDVDVLEGEYGPLPEGVTREDVLDFALENNLVSPAETYFRMVGPIRKDIAAAAKSARAEALERLRQDAGGGPRPRSSGPTAPKEFTGTVKEVFADAAAAAAADLGTNWKDALKAQGWAGSELED